MSPNVPLALLPDLSARIMRQTMTNELGVNWESFCRHNQLKSVCLDNSMTQLLAQEEGQLQQGFAELTANHSNLWFEVGLRYRSIKFGAMGFAMMTAQTFGEALTVACHYQALTYSLINYRYVAAPNGACALIADADGIPAHLYNFTQHRDLGTVRTLIADLMTGESLLERVSVAAPPPANWTALSKNFSCPVIFNADRTEWSFLPGSAERLLPFGDRELATLYRSRCDEQLGRAAADAPITYRLNILLTSRADVFLSASEAAKQLALSERTLHRRLAEEGTRFSAMVDDARYARARALLADRRINIETIAFAVGFAEPSSFSRAFKRWSGISAVEYRRQLA